MKIGYYCESPADMAALKVFTEAILGAPPEPICMDLAAQSVPGFFSSLEGVLRGVHYNSDAEGLIIVVDCDSTEPHAAQHEEENQDPGDCRYCQIKSIVARVRQHLKPRKHLPELKIAIGLAVPTIEAWYLVGKESQVGEAAWQVGRKQKKQVFARPQLKKLVYGTDRPSLERETDCAVAAATRIIQDLAKIETAFPDGFGTMATEIRLWKV